MKNEIIELSEKELSQVNGGNDVAYGGAVATAGSAAAYWGLNAALGAAQATGVAVTAATVSPILLGALVVVGVSAFVYGVWTLAHAT